MATQRALVLALLDQLRRGAGQAPVTLRETHISYVLLTGRYAYKIKKAVNFGFLDFRTLAQRRRCCADELRLNRRLAPEIYLDVVPIHGPPQAPGFGRVSAVPTGGRALEYAVKMREFAQSARFDRRLEQGLLRAEQIDALADRIAEFHAHAARQPPADDFGSAAQIWQLAADNFTALRQTPENTTQAVLRQQLEDWSRGQFEKLEPLLAERRRDGFVRECHGDLHLGNIALVDRRPLIFDCLEFNVQLRWIDVIDEIAFLAMDLDERGRPDLAWRCINRYLENTGDYAGLRCLPFYLVYRALVRAKVAALRAAQEASPAANRDFDVGARYLACAARASAPHRRQLLLMHGVSGSGKSALAQQLLECLGAPRLRSDVERKRLFDLPPLARSHSPPNCGLYAAAATDATYQRLLQLARTVLCAGLAVVVDAACLKRWQRALFTGLADELGVPLRIVSCRADPATLRQRLLARQRSGEDASEADLAIVDQQLRDADPLSADEERVALVFDSQRQTPGQFARRQFRNG